MVIRLICIFEMGIDAKKMTLLHANNKGADQSAQTDQRLRCSLSGKKNLPNLLHAKFRFSS